MRETATRVEEGAGTKLSRSEGSLTMNREKANPSPFSSRQEDSVIHRRRRKLVWPRRSWLRVRYPIRVVPTRRVAGMSRVGPPAMWPGLVDAGLVEEAWLSTTLLSIGSQQSKGILQPRFIRRLRDLCDGPSLMYRV